MSRLRLAKRLVRRLLVGRRELDDLLDPRDELELSDGVRDGRETDGARRDGVRRLELESLMLLRLLLLLLGLLLLLLLPLVPNRACCSLCLRLTLLLRLVLLLVLLLVSLSLLLAVGASGREGRRDRAPGIARRVLSVERLDERLLDRFGVSVNCCFSSSSGSVGVGLTLRARGTGS